jgi:porphyrinogen peroxidase
VVRVAGAGRAASMSTVNAQPGIFALGTPEHAYLEFDLAPGTPPVELVRAAAGLVDPLSTTGGVNLVVGFRPELWAEVADPADVPASTQGWAEPLVGPDGWSMPATQQDAFLWVAGGNRTAVFDNGRAVVRAPAPVARLCRETDGWTYRHDRDLTGFIDGTENPSLLTAPAVALVPAGQPGAGSSARPGPGDLHRNTATGTLSAHGTAFVGFSAEQGRLAEMLRRMAGLGDGIRDALTRYTRPVTGAYYTVPSVDALSRFAPTT